MPLIERITEDTHPLLRPQGVAFHIAPLMELRTVLVNSLRIGEPSLCVVGNHRCGKSTAATYFEKLFAREGVPVLLFLVEEQKKSTTTNISKQEFWDWLLEAQGVNTWISSPGKARQRLINELIANAGRIDNQRVIFIVDEAQNMVPLHYGMLKQLTEELIRKRLAPFVLLFAQPHIEDLVQAMLKGRKRDLVDRFFTQRHRFRGLKPEEFAGVCATCDRMTFPADSNTTYSAFFAPSLSRDGWVLEQEANAFVDEFRSLHAKFQLGHMEELDTKYLMSGIRWLLTSLQKDEEAGRRVNPRVYIPEAVQRSGVVQGHRVLAQVP